MHGILTPANSRIDLRNIRANTASINQMLSDINLRVYAGASGRSIDMSGAFNSPPSADGIISKNKILAKGIEIKTNNP